MTVLKPQITKDEFYAHPSNFFMDANRDNLHPSLYYIHMAHPSLYTRFHFCYYMQPPMFHELANKT